MAESVPYIYILVRLSLSQSDRIVQVGHLMQQVGSRHGCHPETHFVVCGMDDKGFDIETFWATRGLREGPGWMETFYEPAMGRVTCAAVVNITHSQGRKLYGHLPLL